MPSIKALITVALLGASSVTATWGKFHQPVNWGCGNSKAPQKERDDCSSRGSFFTYIGGKGKAVCCSEKTKTPVSSLFLGYPLRPYAVAPVQHADPSSFFRNPAAP
jgi:hypothetical protein